MPFPGIVNPPRAGARRSLARSSTRFMLHPLAVATRATILRERDIHQDRPMHPHLERIGCFVAEWETLQARLPVSAS